MPPACAGGISPALMKGVGRLPWRIKDIDDWKFVMVLRFTPHGALDFCVQGQTIYRYFEGPWNPEFVHQAQQRLEQVTEVDFSRPWVNMLVVRRSALCSPQALAMIKEDLARRVNRQRVATAWVYPPGTEGATVMESALRPLYEGRLVEFLQRCG